MSTKSKAAWMRTVPTATASTAARITTSVKSGTRASTTKPERHARRATHEKSTIRSVSQLLYPVQREAVISRHQRVKCADVERPCVNLLEYTFSGNVLISPQYRRLHPHTQL